MKRLLFLLAFLPVVAFGQIRPDLQPVVASPDTTNFEVYGQKDGTLRRATLDALGRYFFQNLDLSYDSDSNRIYLASYTTLFDSITIVAPTITSSFANDSITIDGTALYLGGYDNNLSYNSGTYKAVLTRSGTNDTIDLSGLVRDLSYDNSTTTLSLGSDDVSLADLRQTISYDSATNTLTLDNSGGSVILTGAAGLSSISTASYFGGDGTSGSPLTIDANGLTFGMLPTISNSKLLGRYSAGSGNIESLTLTADFSIDGSGNISVNNDSLSLELSTAAYFGGDGTSGNPLTIDDAGITWSKVESVSAGKLLGRYSVSSGATQEITLTPDFILDTSTGNLSVNPDSVTLSFTELNVSNYLFDVTQDTTGKNNYVLTYVDSSGQISLRPPTSLAFDTTFTSDGTDIPASFFNTLFETYNVIHLDAIMDVGPSSGLIINLPAEASYPDRKIIITGVNNTDDTDYNITVSGIDNFSGSAYYLQSGETIELESARIGDATGWIMTGTSRRESRYSAGANVMVRADGPGVTASKSAGSLTITVPASVNLHSFRFIGAAADLSGGAITVNIVGGYGSGVNFNTGSTNMYYPFVSLQNRASAPYLQRPDGPTDSITIYHDGFSTSGTVSITVQGLSGDFGINGNF